MWQKSNYTRLIVATIACLRAFVGFAQLPETDIWLFRLDKKDSVYMYKDGLNITNRAGYDNQPCFTPDGKQVLYVGICEDSQADIYSYAISKHESHRLTSTPESEYSPQLTPDGLGITCVVVEKDSAQRIWQYDLQGRFKRIVSPGTDSVGYYTWLNKDSLLYYKLTEPHSLHALNLLSGKDAWICNHPSRAFKPLPGTHSFLYAVKDSASMEYRLYDPVLRSSSRYCQYPSPGEDFIWNGSLGLLRPEGASLLRYNPRSGRWETFLSFEKAGIKKITRFAFDAQNKQLLIVNNL